MAPAPENAALPGPGGQGRPPLQNPIGKRCVGAGGCPPSCQPIPGHCRVRQSGHFLETGSLHLPLAALCRFPRRPELGLYRIPCNVSLRGRSASVAIRTPSSSASFRQGGLSDASHPSSYRISQCACWKNIFYQLSFIPNRIDCSFSFQRLSVWMTSSSVSVFGRICKMENWKNLYRSGCAQITSFISLLCPCSEST